MVRADMVAVDTSVLLLFLNPRAKAPVDPSTGEPVERAGERIEYLITTLETAGEHLLVPTPVLCEVLVHADTAKEAYIRCFNDRAVFRIVPFGIRAAIEAAKAKAQALKRGGHRVDVVNPDATKTKIEFDRQLVAIAKVEGAHTIYSDDEDIHKQGVHARLKTLRTADLGLPPEKRA